VYVVAVAVHTAVTFGGYNDKIIFDWDLLYVAVWYLTNGYVQRIEPPMATRANVARGSRGE